MIRNNKCVYCDKEFTSSRTYVLHLVKEHHFVPLEAILFIINRMDRLKADNNIHCIECNRIIPDGRIWQLLDEHGKIAIPKFCSNRCKKRYHVKKKNKELQRNKELPKLVWDDCLTLEEIFKDLHYRFYLPRNFYKFEKGTYRTKYKTKIVVSKPDTRLQEAIQLDTGKQINITIPYARSRRIIVALLSLDNASDTKYTYIASSGDVEYRMACVETFSKFHVEKLVESLNSRDISNIPSVPGMMYYGIPNFVTIEETLKDIFADAKVKNIGLRAHFTEDDAPYQDDEHYGSFYRGEIFEDAVTALTDLLDMNGIFEPSMKDKSKIKDSTEDLQKFVAKSLQK